MTSTRVLQRSDDLGCSQVQAARSAPASRLPSDQSCRTPPEEACPCTPDPSSEPCRQASRDSRGTTDPAQNACANGQHRYAQSESCGGIVVSCFVSLVSSAASCLCDQRLQSPDLQAYTKLCFAHKALISKLAWAESFAIMPPCHDSARTDTCNESTQSCLCRAHSASRCPACRTTCAPRVRQTPRWSPDPVSIKSSACCTALLNNICMPLALGLCSISHGCRSLVISSLCPYYPDCLYRGQPG